MALSAGFTLTCGSCAAAVAAFYFANKTEVDSFTDGTEGIYTAVTMVGLGDVFYSYDFQDQTGEWRENAAAVNAGCGMSVTEEIEFTLPCKTVAQRNAVQALMDASCCGMVGIVELTDGTMWVVGELPKQSLKFLNSAGTTGKLVTDAVQVVVTLQALTTALAKKFTGSVPL